jgi:MFS family permease
LLIARFVQGVASGTAMSGLAAGLLDMLPAVRAHAGARVTAIATSAGMALGAGGMGLLLESSSRPDRYAFPLLAALFVCLAAAMLFLPEVSTPLPFGWAALRPRIGIDPAARSTFVATVPTTVAGWAATGLFLALVPSLVREVVHVEIPAIGGLSITGLYLAVTAGGLWAGRLRLATVTLLGSVLMGLGALASALALGIASAVVFAVGSLAAGLGVGLTFSGNLRAVGATTNAENRSATFAIVYLISYTSLSLPSLLAGIAEPFWGLRATADCYLAFVALLALTAAAHAMSRNGWFTSMPRRHRAGRVTDG